MNSPHLISMLSIALASFFSIACAISLWLVHKARQNAQNCVALAHQLEDELSSTSRDLDTLTQRLSEQSRRVAWLETRVRPKTLAAQTTLPDAPISDTKLNMTERRHRVLKLARRGQDSLKIANTLGMPYGEVELIIGLHQAV